MVVKILFIFLCKPIILMKNQLQTCKNCEEQFQVGFKFCPHCGQQAKDELTVKVLFYNTISNYFSFDARFFKSFLPLLFKPGFLARKFIAGKRLLYLHPAQMYLFITVVFFFLFSFVQRQQIESIDDSLAKTLKHEKNTDGLTLQHVLDSIVSVDGTKQNLTDSIDRADMRDVLKKNKALTGLSEKQIDTLVNTGRLSASDTLNFDLGTKAIDSLIAIGAPDEEIYKQMGLEEGDGAFKRRLYAQGLKFYKSRKGGSILQAFYDTIPIAMFFLLPIFAFILKLFYRKHGLYAHHLVFSFYYFAFLFTVFSVILIINFIYDFPDWLDFIVMLSTFFYLLLGLKYFYEQGWFKTILKTSLTTFLFLSVVAPLTVIILGVFAFLFY